MIDIIVRERLDIDTIRCESQITRLAAALAPVRGLHEARVEFGASALVVDYEDAVAAAVDEAIGTTGLRVVGRSPA